MKSKQSFEQCYNAQAVVEEGRQLIVAQEVGQSSADNESLAPLVDQVKQNTGCKPRRVLADAGYKGEKNCKALEKRKIRGFVAQGRESRQEEGPAGGGGPASRRMVKRLKDQRGKRQYRRRKGMVGAGVWVGEASVRIPAILAARAAKGARRMESGDAGFEPAADGVDGGGPGVDLGGS